MADTLNIRKNNLMLILEAMKSSGEMTAAMIAEKTGLSAATISRSLLLLKTRGLIISCGKDNDYGHPHKETIEKLEKYNIPYERTDIKGTIVVGSDGEHLSTAFPDNKTAEK